MNDNKGEEQDNPTLFEIMKESPNITYSEATKVQEDLRVKREAGACITSGIKRDRDAMDKMKKRAQEAEGELSIVKGVGMNSPEMKEAQERIKELQIRLAEALEISDAHQKQMGKLQVRLTEVEEDNKKLAHQIEDLKLNGVRKAGL